MQTLRIKRALAARDPDPSDDWPDHLPHDGELGWLGVLIVIGCAACVLGIAWKVFAP